MKTNMSGARRNWKADIGCRLTGIVERDRVRLMSVNCTDKPEDARAWLENPGNAQERIGRAHSKRRS